MKIKGQLYHSITLEATPGYEITDCDFDGDEDGICIMIYEDYKGKDYIPKKTFKEQIKELEEIIEELKKSHIDSKFENTLESIITDLKFKINEQEREIILLKTDKFSPISVILPSKKSTDTINKTPPKYDEKKCGCGCGVKFIPNGPNHKRAPNCKKNKPKKIKESFYHEKVCICGCKKSFKPTGSQSKYHPDCAERIKTDRTDHNKKFR